MDYHSKPGDLNDLLRQWAPKASDVFAASPYITSSGSFTALTKQATSFRLLTQVTVGDLATGVTQVGAIKAALRGGVMVRNVPSTRRLHAKVFGLEGLGVVVGSANLTFAGIKKNVEAGVVLPPSELDYWRTWFDEQWDTSLPLSETHLAELEIRAAEAKVSPADKAEDVWMPERTLAQGLALDIESGWTRVVMCNSNRGHVDPLVCERWMLTTGRAAAWEDFDSTPTFASLVPGNILLLHASGITKIVAVGRVVDTPTIVQPGDARHIGSTINTPQHSVDVEWVQLSNPVHWTNVPRGTVKETDRSLDSVRSRLVRALFRENPEASPG